MTTIQAGDWMGTLNGLNIGLGSPFLIAGLHGWRTNTALPLGGASTGSSQLPAPKPFANGSWAVPYYMPSREVTLLLDIVATSVTSFGDAVAQLEAATVPQGAALPALTLQLDGQPTTVYGTFTSRDIPTEFEYQFGLSRATLVMTCPDPRRFFTDASASGFTNLPTASGGVTWPVTFPLTWSGVTSSGNITLNNPGNTAGPISMNIYGPVSAPFVTHTDANGVLSQLAFSSALNIAAGDHVTIDCEARTVLYNGQASRNGMLTSRGWFQFTPGDNRIAFGAYTYNASAGLQVSATPAWI